MFEIIKAYFDSEQELHTLSGLLFYCNLSISDIISMDDAKKRQRAISYIKSRLLEKNSIKTAKTQDLIFKEFDDLLGFVPDTSESIIYLVKVKEIDYKDWKRLQDEKIEGEIEEDE